MEELHRASSVGRGTELPYPLPGRAAQLSSMSFFRGICTVSISVSTSRMKAFVLCAFNFCAPFSTSIVSTISGVSLFYEAFIVHIICRALWRENAIEI